MSRPRTPISAFYPLVMALMLVVGLFIGHGIGHPERPLPVIFSTRGTSANEKVGQVLDLIDRQYVDPVEKEALVDEVLQDLLQQLDPHSYYISAAELRAAQEPLEGSFEGIGVEFAIQRDTIVVVAPVEGGPSEALGIRSGDRILQADSVPLAGVGITNREVMDNLRGPGGSEVKVTLLRPGRKAPFDVTITRGKVPITSVAATILTPDSTGYIKLVRFARTTHEEFLQAADDLLSRGMKRLVLDLRGNGGGYLNSAIDLADEFLPEGRMIVYTEGRHSPRRDFRSSDRGLLEDMPLAVLIDEGSASASEILAGAVQDNDRGLVVGRRTFGKGLVQEHVDLPDQSAVRLTTARYYTPSGRSIQRPYGEGIDYLADFEDRFLHGELVNKDSVHQDTSEVFTTLKGRKVYGGGGIMPDIFVAADTAEGNAYLSALFFSGVLNQFAFDVADRERAALEAFGSSGAFDAGFRVDQALLEELKRFAAGQGVREEPSSEALRLAAERLKAGIARNIWGSSGFYEVLLDDDPIFQRARSEIGGA